ncbi:hypothetical protein K469DRAFT_702342 [Zopfia rhizophila CBS 207.26]|uniref:Uncharacterized protein n=1 Tax=Zopfia rhizophila CBS 207.26 TaxID=1314779 RepID=A0A6A6D7C5_9PEZI|nr:hypothetical protein K469DRAFT_702342 [Zopfia rhizophila CBS 207.26]
MPHAHSPRTTTVHTPRTTAVHTPRMTVAHHQNLPLQKASLPCISPPAPRQQRNSPTLGVHGPQPFQTPPPNITHSPLSTYPLP